MKRKNFLSIPISIIFLASLLTFQTTLAYWNVTSGAASDIFTNIQIGEWTPPSDSNKPIGALTPDEYEAKYAGADNILGKWDIIYLTNPERLVLVIENHVSKSDILQESQTWGQKVFVKDLSWIPYPKPANSYQEGSVVLHEGDYYRAPRTMWEYEIPGTEIWMPWALLNINNMTYSHSETYVLYDVVTYNGKIYQIIKAEYITAANNNVPGAVPYSWQQIDGFYSETNVYNISDIVVYQNRVYRSLQNNTLARPEDLNNPDWWVKYGE